MKVYIEAFESSHDPRGQQVHVAEAVTLTRLVCDVEGDKQGIMEELITALLTSARRVTIEVLE